MAVMPRVPMRAMRPPNPAQSRAFVWFRNNDGHPLNQQAKWIDGSSQTLGVLAVLRAIVSTTCRPSTADTSKSIYLIVSA
jgi:hypothetical protein